MLVAVVGPTAVGKTELALNVAARLEAEIVSADSMQVYRGMDIGTAKATPEQQERIRHHGLDLVDPSTKFSVADYEREASLAITNIRRRGRLPLIAGGTGLYVRALVDGLGLSAPGPDWQLRQQLAALAERQGNEALYARLLEVDPPTARRLHPNDRRRVIRALEVYQLTGEPLSRFHARDQKHREEQQQSGSVLLFGLHRHRDMLYERIEKRIIEQLRQGLLSEIRGLVHRGFGDNFISLQALGYKEFLPYLQGKQSLASCIDTLKQNTRQLAKRQLTWFRPDRRIHWLSLDQLSRQAAEDKIVSIVKSHLAK